MDFKQRVEQAFNEWKENGCCEEARLLNEGVGTDYFDTANPHFFTGDVDSELVLVHLNPKRDKSQWNKKCHFSDFESYWRFYARFGNRHYGKDSVRTHKSQFDHKQIRFLKPFDVLPLNNDDIYQNLENVIDNKLQIELVPFGSPEFKYHTIGTENLDPFIDSLLLLIKEKPRKYVIFCGRVFEHVLRNFIQSEKTHPFTLTKKDGTQTKSDFHVINITIGKGHDKINACIAPQFAKQGYPVMEYGSKVKEFYGRRS